MFDVVSHSHGATTHSHSFSKYPHAHFLRALCQCSDSTHNIHEKPAITIEKEEDGQWGKAIAVFNMSKTHRYLLTRTWDTKLPLLGFCMLNPSTADAFQLDPTVRRCVGYAQDWGYGGLVVTNIFALRSTDPKALYTAEEPIGVDNDYFIQVGYDMCDMTIAGWGTHGKLNGRGTEVKEKLGEIKTLKVTKAGFPSHPLYLAKDLKPIDL